MEGLWANIHYPKDRKPSLKLKTSLVLGLYRGFYRHTGVLEDETGPCVEDRRVVPPNCRGFTAIVADPRQNQGVNSLVLARILPLLRGPSWYIPIMVFSPEYSSDVRKGLGSMHLLDAVSYTHLTLPTIYSV